jgi:hypothetical protein
MQLFTASNIYFLTCTLLLKDVVTLVVYVNKDTPDDESVLECCAV